MFRHKNYTFILLWQDVRLISLLTNNEGMDRDEYVHHKKVRKNGESHLQTVDLQRPIAIKRYIKYMRGVDGFDQMIKYYSFTRKTWKWTKKVVMYFIQTMLHNAHILYKKYGPQGKKMTLLQFHQIAYDALLNFNSDEWPSNQVRLPHRVSIFSENHVPPKCHLSQSASFCQDPGISSVDFWKMTSINDLVLFLGV